MRREWDRLPSWHPIRGLFWRAYPAYMIAPWEEPTEVQKERPANIPPDEAPVTSLSDGRVIVYREDGDLPLLLEPEGDGPIRATNVLA